MRPAVNRPLDTPRGGENHAVEEIMQHVTPSSVPGLCGPGKASCLNAYARRTAGHFDLYSPSKENRATQSATTQGSTEAKSAK